MMGKDALMEKYLPQILGALPTEWRGTTFKNAQLLGRETFSELLVGLLEQKQRDGGSVSTGDLNDLGNAEDYLRVSSNISSTLELFLSRRRGLPIEKCFTFASTAMPLVAVLLTVKPTVHFYHGDAGAPFTPAQLRTLKLLSCNFVCHAGAPRAHADGVVVATESASLDTGLVDAVIDDNVLYIYTTKISHADVLVIRKRMSTPVTTPVAETMLQTLSGAHATASRGPAPSDLAAFYAHLQNLCGTDTNINANPVVFTAGLPAICSLYVAMIARGGADVLMCSTAYGGSSQLTDVLTAKAPTLRKHNFHIQGDANMVISIQEELNKLASNAANLAPTTVLFVEVPTNPDMKVPDLDVLVNMIRNYKRATKKNFLLLVDTTFAPGSQLLKKFKALDPDLTVMVFISMSKSVSRGTTTAGTIVANHTAEAQSILSDVRASAVMLDTQAKNDQLCFLSDNHVGTEERCDQAYNVAVTIGNVLSETVKQLTKEELDLHFVAPHHAAIGLTSSTFSFNLPSPKGNTAEENEALAQKFVDILCIHPSFKPCVSFGQDNGLVYCTVPATSTQGAIKAEDKAKQAVGGVQLVRLSFPPTCELDAVINTIRKAISFIYTGTTSSL